MPNCDWGRPCSCEDCREIDENLSKNMKCCQCDKKAEKYTRVLTTDRKGVTGYITTAYCKDHYPDRVR